MLEEEISKVHLAYELVLLIIVLLLTTIMMRRRTAMMMMMTQTTASNPLHELKRLLFLFHTYNTGSSISDKFIFVFQTEARLLDANWSPECKDDFEKLVFQSPLSSMAWLGYTAFHLARGEVEAGRSVMERALRRIPFTFVDTLQLFMIDYACICTCTYCTSVLTETYLYSVHMKYIHMFEFNCCVYLICLKTDIQKWFWCIVDRCDRKRLF